MGAYPVHNHNTGVVGDCANNSIRVSLYVENNFVVREKARRRISCLNIMARPPIRVFDFSNPYSERRTCICVFHGKALQSSLTNQPHKLRPTSSWTIIVASTFPRREPVLNRIVGNLSTCSGMSRWLPVPHYARLNKSEQQCARHDWVCQRRGSVKLPLGRVCG